MKSQENLKYPVGKFQYGKTYSLDDTRKHIKAIARLPKELKKLLKKLKGNRIDLPYRRGGWTARQVFHHIVDSHVNAYIRMKMAVTEQAPIIKPYEESLWAETEDGKNAPVKLSLRILAPLHKRWVMFLESLSEEELERSYYHPGMQRLIPLPEAIALYAWHSLHHTAHIRIIVEGKGYHKTEEKKTKVSKPRSQKAKTAASSSSTKTATAPPTRKRRSSAEVAAEKAAKAAAPKLSRAEILAKARAARTANIAQKPPAKPKKAAAPAPKRTRRSSAEVAAEKAAKAAAPKLSRAEILAKARAARTANIAQKPPAVKKAKPAGATKRKGLSAERMAEIRAMRGKKK